MKKQQLKNIFVTGALVLMASPAWADEAANEKIAHALSAAPASISADATVMDSDGTVLRAGSNGWTCLPDTMPGDGNPICNDAVWMEMFQAVMQQADYTPTKIGISYMLQGDKGAGVSNATPYHADHANAEDYAEMGPHLMIIVPKAQLEGMSTDHLSGGPYVMWAGTPYAHIMVPVAE